MHTTPLDYDLLKQYRDDLKNAISNKKDTKIKKQQQRNHSDNTKHNNSATNSTKIPIKLGTNIYVSNRKKREEYQAKSEREERMSR